MTADFKAEIVRIAYWKQIAAQHDKLGALPWHLPKIAASEEKIAKLRDVAGISLPDDYIAFLRLADGWKGFLVLTDLFGTEDFLTVRSREFVGRPDVQYFLRRSGIVPDSVVAIGASEFEPTVFLLVSVRSDFLPGGVIWLSSEEIERYPSFSEFFSSMVNCNAKVAQDTVREGEESPSQ